MEQAIKEHEGRIAQLIKEQDRYAEVRRKGIEQRLDLSRMPFSTTKRNKLSVIRSRNKVIDSYSKMVAADMRKADKDLEDRKAKIEQTTMDTDAMDPIAIVFDLSDNWIIWTVPDQTKDDDLWKWDR